MTSLRVGDKVRLLRIPKWLTHDLPQDEQDAIKAQVDKIMRVTEIDAHGYVWLSFGVTTSVGDTAQYKGHSFAVDAASVEKLD
jgi:hypothetical protein